MQRLLAILVTGAALWALWAGYGALSVFRGTLFWDYRYILFACLAFLGLGALEWALGWLRARFDGKNDPH